MPNPLLTLADHQKAEALRADAERNNNNATLT